MPRGIYSNLINEKPGLAHVQPHPEVVVAKKLKLIILKSRLLKLSIVVCYLPTVIKGSVIWRTEIGYLHNRKIE
jgi:hypothetical protein